MADVMAFQQFTLKGVHISQTMFDSGSFTLVLELEYRGLKCTGKKLKHSFDEVEMSQVTQRYLEACQLLSQTRHPNIVQFFGICFEEGSQIPILVMEYLPTNLTNCLDCYGILPDEISYAILHDVSLGIAYLHGQSPPIIHKDLTSNSVLLSSNMTAKISDLVIARILNLTLLQVTQMSKTSNKSAYMPPEMMALEPQHDSSVDVFSFGVMIIHTFTAEWPLPKVGFGSADQANQGNQIAVTEVKKREEFFQKISQDHLLTDLIMSCLENNPQKRPRAEEIVGRMGNVVLQFPPSFANRMEILQHISALSSQKHQVAQEMMCLESALQDKQSTIERKQLDIAHSIRTKQLQLENEALRFELKINQTELESYKAQCKDLTTRMEEQIASVALLQEKLATIEDLESELASIKVTQKAQEEREKIRIKANKVEITCKDSVISIKEDCLLKYKSDMKDLNQELQKLWIFLSQQPQSLQVQLSHSPCTEAPVRMHTGKAIAINNLIYYGGGICEKEDCNYYIYCYNTSQDLWSTLPKLSVQYFGIGEVKGQLVIVGGVNEAFNPTTKLQVYNKKTWKQTIPSMPTPKGTPAVVSLSDHLVVAGGHLESAIPITNSVEIYSSSTNQWSKANKLPFAGDMLRTATCNNTIYLMGGWNKSGLSNSVITAEVDKLISNSLPANQEDVQAPANNSTWQQKEYAPGYRFSAVTVLDTVFTVGGVISHEGTPTQRIHAYSTSLNLWLYAGDLPSPVVSPATVSLSPTEFLVIGGRHKRKSYLSTVYKVTLSSKI